MATSKRKVIPMPARKRAGKGGSQQGADGTTVKVSLEPSIDTVPIYSNHIEVGHTRHEFTILIGRVPGKMPAETFASAAASGQLLLEPDATVLVPPTLVPGLIKALEAQLHTWEEKFGPVTR